MSHTGQAGPAEYSRLLDREPAEYARFFDSLSVSVTQFFRDASAFAYIRDRVLPAILADKAASGSRMLRVWSAGCATGQEAWSLAILLAEALAGRRRKIMARVYATDVDAGALARARRAEYAADQMEGVTGSYALPHFILNGHYSVAPDLRHLVRFRQHDLTTDPPLRYVDLLLCRNVLIYFGRDTQRRVLESFDTAIRPGGFLVLGKTEMMNAETRGRFVPVDIKERVYRKLRARLALQGGR